MKHACILGGGPSGIFTAKLLSSRGIGVNLFEIGSRLLGNYFYARNQSDILSGLQATVHLNNKTLNDKQCDFYVVATGGKPRELEIEGHQHAIQAMDLIRRGGDHPIGQKLCIIGMGNVALDVLYCLKKNGGSVTVLGRNGVDESKFDNHVFRESVEDSVGIMKVENISNNRQNIDNDSRKIRRKYDLLKQASSPIGSWIRHLKGRLFGAGKPAVRFIFEATPRSIKPVDGQLEVAYLVNSELKRESFDKVISSVGFIPNPAIVKTSKPVYHTGWCVKSQGNIGDAMLAAKATVEKIMKDINGK